MSYPDKIFLVGMPGSGKSTFGKKLADRVEHSFFDLDEQVENMMGQPIPEIFEEHGEGEFRDMEFCVLKMLIQLNEPALISTGGGTPCFFSNMELMNKSGATLFLDTPFDELLARLNNEKDARPLISKMQDPESELKTMYDKRLPFYKEAALTSKDSNMEEIIDFLFTFNVRNSNPT